MLFAFAIVPVIEHQNILIDIISIVVSAVSTNTFLMVFCGLKHIVYSFYFNIR